MWKQLRNTRYEVSTEGEIRNSKTLRLLKQHKTPKGYMLIGIYENEGGNKKTYLVHRLIAETFLDNYSNNLPIHHKNGITYDNRVDNLECVSFDYNNSDRVFGLCSIKEIEEIIKLYNKELSPEEIYIFLREQAKKQLFP